MNRGLARRTLFENECDIRFFLSRLARLARAGDIEVHAFCILTTHFHLLVRSPAGMLSRVMQRVQNDYSRRFNRARRRDGTLYRARFRSKRADTLTYRQHLVRYIDQNPVSAQLVPTPALYPHGSARCYARVKGPPWLTRSWVEDIVRRSSGKCDYDPRDYAGSLGKPLSARLASLVEKRLELSNDRDDPLDDLLAAAPPRVLAWMRRKAVLADGTDVGMPVCDGDSVDETLAEARREERDWTLAGAQKLVSAWPIAHVALLRDLCGAPLRETGARTRSSSQHASRRYARHRLAIEESGEYAIRIAKLASRALERCHG